LRDDSCDLRLRDNSSDVRLCEDQNSVEVCDAQERWITSRWTPWRANREEVLSCVASVFRLLDGQVGTRRYLLVQLEEPALNAC
jgi:hypothetical protein